MQVFDTITGLQSMLNSWKNRGEKIAFVPTMGGLHQGHLSLIEIAKRKADKVVVSIFVNPTQFAEHEDFDTYPRAMDTDLKALSLVQTDLVFTPDTNDIYPDGLTLERNEFTENKVLFEILCGQSRPHFFYGVLQVVRRLFDIISPDIAVFGQKDYQQLHIVKRFTSGVKIIKGAIVREHDGLAISTRNQYLSESERKIAPQLYQTLVKIKEGELDMQSGVKALRRYFKLDYLESLDANTLRQTKDNTRRIVVLCAVYLGSTRLIDNIIIKK